MYPPHRSRRALHLRDRHSSQQIREEHYCLVIWCSASSRPARSSRSLRVNDSDGRTSIRAACACAGEYAVTKRTVVIARRPVRRSETHMAAAIRAPIPTGSWWPFWDTPTALGFAPCWCAAQRQINHEMRIPKINCPHCGSVATIRTSRPVSRITQELYCQCSNVICGHTFVSLVEVVRTLSPSSTPDPEGGPPACRPY